MKCKYCPNTATKGVVWAEGKARVPTCNDHVLVAKKAILPDKPDQIVDLAEVLTKTIDLVSSRVYPGLERKPGGPDNWVEQVKGLPSYIERIAKHMHYEQGFTISHSIAAAVNTVKRWAAGGTVTEHGTTKRVSPATQAKAAAALAQWESKKAAARALPNTPGWGRRGR